MGPRCTRIALALGLISLAALWLAWSVYERRRSQTLLAFARSEMSHNRWTAARAALNEVLNHRPNWDEAVYELGVCELARGRLLRGGRGVGPGPGPVVSDRMDRGPAIAP